MQKQQRKKVVLLSEIFPPRHGGSGRWLFEIYRRQTSFEAVAIVDELDTTLKNKSPVKRNAWIQRIPFSIDETAAFSLSGWKAYRRVQRSINSNLNGLCFSEFHAARVLPEGWLAYLQYRSKGTPFICYAHGEEINLRGSENSGVMSSRQHRWMAKLVFRATKKIIANSSNTEKLLLEQWAVPPSKVVVMNPGVDASFFCPSPTHQHTSAIDQGGIAPILLTVGRLQKRKGHDQVIRALPLIRAKYPSVRYIIAGDGEERETLKRLSKNCNVEPNIIWKTNCSDTELLELYQQCNLFILANRQVGSDVEGFGMVLLEAASCEKPTITCDSGGTKEAIDDGTTGVLLEDSKPERIADCVCELLADPQRCAEFGAAGRRRVLDHYDWKILADQFRTKLD